MLKKSTLVGLSALMLSAAIAPSAYADIRDFEITPFALVNLARNGALTDQGVPSFGQLSADHQSGRLKAIDVIQAAIADGRLASNASEDDDYVHAVEQQLRLLDGSRNK